VEFGSKRDREEALAIHCDECDDKILDLDNATQVGGSILCSDCYDEYLEDEDEEDESAGDPKKYAYCGNFRCRKYVPENTLIEKLEGSLLCRKCAHAYELKLFTPPDHQATTCDLYSDNPKPNTRKAA
jgi:hypothetical protein